MEVIRRFFIHTDKPTENIAHNDIDLNPELAVQRTVDETPILKKEYKPKAHNDKRIRTLYHHVLSDPLFKRAIDKIKNIPDQR